jgi:60 kDa SS-A/Ro ribonucleoprotein
VELSVSGRAPKQNPCLFALAAAAGLGDEEGRRAALDALPQVARIGTHLFIFARYVEQFRGWGRQLRRGVADWYTAKSVDDLAFQAVKYRQREGWSHRDLLRLSHPETTDENRKQLFDWVCGREISRPAQRTIEGFLQAQTADSKAIPRLVRDYRLTWEMLPDTALSDPKVWEALLENGMPQTALMRQLPRLTNLGLLGPLGSRTRAVADQLADPELLTKARVHPINVLVAQRTYASGHSARGAGSWSPSRPIVDALDAAFYASFGNVVPTGKRTLLALDVSGSMGASISNMPITCREASAALAMVTARTETDYEIVGFTSSYNTSGTRSRYGWNYGQRSSTVLTPLGISPRQRLDDVIRAVSHMDFGGTDCSLPMRYALAQGLMVDTFCVYTDNETWAGEIHPHQALTQYRERVNPAAKLIVIGMTATNFSIADPSDAGMLDVAGFDSAVPQLISDFARD